MRRPDCVEACPFIADCESNIAQLEAQSDQGPRTLKAIGGGDRVFEDSASTFRAIKSAALEACAEGGPDYVPRIPAINSPSNSLRTARKMCMSKTLVHLIPVPPDN